MGGRLPGCAARSAEAARGVAGTIGACSLRAGKRSCTRDAVARAAVHFAARDAGSRRPGGVPGHGVASAYAAVCAGSPRCAGVTARAESCASRHTSIRPSRCGGGSSAPGADARSSGSADAGDRTTHVGRARAGFSRAGPAVGPQASDQPVPLE